MKNFMRQILHDIGLVSDPIFCVHAPAPAPTVRVRKQKQDDGVVGEHGHKTVETETRTDGGEWVDKTAAIGTDTTRQGQFTDTDTLVLNMSEFVDLDKDKYCVMKLVWAKNISSKKAGSEPSVMNLRGVGSESTRDRYWKAFGVSHKISRGEEISRGEAVAVPA